MPHSRLASVDSCTYCPDDVILNTFNYNSLLLPPPSTVTKDQGEVFGCDLAQHLGNTAHDVSQVVKLCAEHIERHGIVNDIYCCSGVISNVNKLREKFNAGTGPDLMGEAHDIHSKSSLLKRYFRELPDKFAVSTRPSAAHYGQLHHLFHSGSCLSPQIDITTLEAVASF
uniref:Rho GTPase-activating protein 30-like n=1 Tax=Petromyzon marinus TaxID=7757 RepID=A0AAJ7X3S8_PETMA|nr:rho GTPase-activating protein 30-like [Petromyzon marinus]